MGPDRSGSRAGNVRQSLPWIAPENSLQWAGFENLVRILRARDNRVSVIVGPLNEHRLDAASREAYRNLLLDCAARLDTLGLDSLLLPLLPAEVYADLSHPTGPGYALMAAEIWNRFPGLR